MNKDLGMDFFLEGDFEEIKEENSLINEEIDNNITPSEEPPKVPETVAEESEAKGKLSDNPEEHTPSPEDGTTIYSSLATVLQEKGVLPSLAKDTDIKSADDLIGVIKEEIKTNEFAGLSDRQKRYLEALESGIPDELFLEHEKVSTDLNAITDEVIENTEEAGEQLRKGLLKQYFSIKGFSPEEADKLTQQQIDLGEDIEFSKKAVGALKELETQEYNKRLANIEDQRKASEAQFETLKSKVYDTDELIEGIKISKDIKNKVYDTITKVVGKTGQGVPYNALMKFQNENPVEFQHTVSYLFAITDGFKNFSSLTKGSSKKAQSNAVQKLEHLLKSAPREDTGVGVELELNPDADITIDL